MCESYVKECLPIAISESYCRNIQPCIVSVTFKLVFSDSEESGFCLNISTELSHNVVLQMLPPTNFYFIDVNSLHMSL